MKVDICIRGAGIVGKSLALALARSPARIRVGLIGHQKAPKADIRSFALNAASKQFLHELRLWPEEEKVQAVEHMRVFGQSDLPLHFDAPTKNSSAALAWIVDAALLEDRLAQAIEFCPEMSWVDSDDEAALTVICEGKNSQTQQKWGAEFQQFHYGQTAIAALIDCEKPHEATAWQWMRGGEICAFLPRVQAHAQDAVHRLESSVGSSAGNSVALVWSVPDERAKELLAMSPLELTQCLESSSQGRLGTLKLASERAAWPLQLMQAQTWVGAKSATQSWALAGDAAHAVHPLAGQGLNLGLADARELSQILSKKEYFRSFADLRLLRQYERTRKSDAATLRLATDGLAQIFSNPNASVQRLREWGMRSLDAVAPLKNLAMRAAAGKV